MSHHLNLLLVTLLSGSPTLAMAVETTDIVHQGNAKGAAPCAACHGTDGAGQAGTDYPRLAGLDAAYLQKQLDDYALGKRDHAVMTPTAKSLDDGERHALALYYSKLPLPPALARPADLMPPANSMGAVLAVRGVWSRGIPGCEQCHAPGGVGVGSHFPPLAGQPAPYIEAQLKAWQNGSRTNDPLQLMQYLSIALDAQEIRAVAIWFAAQPLPADGASPRIASAIATSSHAATAKNPADPNFAPPSESSIPAGPLGEVIRQGRAIFVDTPSHAKAYVGNGLSCSNCHLDAGRKADSAPLWGAWGMYPQYRKKNGHVNTYGERIQGCFIYSMNGKAPALDSAEIVSLEAYSSWMAKGAPVGEKMKGAGYPKEGFKSPQAPDYARGEKVYENNCALCHGDNGQGQQVAGRNVFPPLWGLQSFNWGAGMHQIDNAAAFIKANMPFGRGDTLADQDAWDVALFMVSHERPQDPRFDGDVHETRMKHHDTPMSLYGIEIQGHVLGAPPRQH